MDRLAHARVLLATDGAGARAAIAESLDAAEALVDASGAEAWRPFVRVERARLARLVGDEATCRRELGEAHRLFTEMGATARAEEVARELK